MLTPSPWCLTSSLCCLTPSPSRGRGEGRRRYYHSLVTAQGTRERSPPSDSSVRPKNCRLNYFHAGSSTQYSTTPKLSPMHAGLKIEALSYPVTCNAGVMSDGGQPSILFSAGGVGKS